MNVEAARPKPGSSSPRILNTVVIGPPDCSRRRWPRFACSARRGRLRLTLEGERKSRFLDIAPENSRNDFESVRLMNAQAFMQPRLQVRVGSPTEDKTSRRPLPRN